MSSEYIYDRKAVNLYGAKGAYTALFVSSHSNNDSDYTPRWSLYKLSKKEDSLSCVLQHAHYCDGDMTQGVRGVKISTTAEISRWREVIATAVLPPITCHVRLRFYENASPYEIPMRTMEKLKSLAARSGIELISDPISRRIDGIETQVGCELLIDLNDPGHVDLIWEASQANTNPEIAENNKPLMPAYNFLPGWVGGNGNHVGVDRHAVMTKPRASKWQLKEKLVKFAFPTEGQPDYKQQVEVVMDHHGNVICGDNCLDRWFGRQLIAIEAAEPGTAEAAYRSFQKLRKETPVTPFESMSVALSAPSPATIKEPLEEWVLGSIAKLFANVGGKPTDPVVNTRTPKDHMAALNLSAYVTCSIDLPDLVLEKPQEQLSLLG